jgi:hemolysin III
MVTRVQTYNEELANGFSHIFGVLFCLIGMPFLVVKAAVQPNLITESSVVVLESECY